MGVAVLTREGLAGIWSKFAETTEEKGQERLVAASEVSTIEKGSRMIILTSSLFYVRKPCRPRR